MYNADMGAFKTRVRITTRQGDNPQEFDAWVDTGAAYDGISVKPVYGRSASGMSMLPSAR